MKNFRSLSSLKKNSIFKLFKVVLKRSIPEENVRQTDFVLFFNNLKSHFKSNLLKNLLSLLK